MGVFHVFQIVQMTPNHAKHHILKKALPHELADNFLL